MAIVQNPITGRTKKKFGTAVFSKQFGKNVMRTKPMEVKNPNTIAQSTHRSKFSIMVALIRQVLPIINTAYAGTIRNMSPFNKIVGINMRNAFAGDPPILDHTKVVLCDFIGNSVTDVTLTGNPQNCMHIEWDPNTSDPDELASFLTFIFINCTTNEAIIFKDAAARSDIQTDLTVPKTWVGCMTALHVLSNDFSQYVANFPKTIIKFKAGVDDASTVQ